ncbi:MAG: SgcJ/EcaC family oxidoreductase [Pseudomonadota bacterium]
MSVVNEVTALFEEWNSALQTGDPKKVAALYADNGILLPTVSNKVRHNHAEIEDYFVHFLAKGPAGKIDEANIRVFGQLAINSGVYTFTFKDGAVVTARYTFVYRWNGQRWMIIEHHSSQMPE